MLIALNIILAGLIYRESRKNVINSEQKSTIISALKKNSIHLSCPLPLSYKPLRNMTVKPYIFSEDEIAALFPNGDLTVDYNTNTYYYNGTNDNPDISGVCENFINSLPFHIKLIKTRTYNNDNINEFEYRGIYKGAIIYSSYICFTFIENGAMLIQCSLMADPKFDVVKRPIAPADEVLFRLMFNIKGDYDDEITISQIDIVYNVTKKDAPLESTLSLSPFYRVYINEELKYDPYLINAYTNKPAE